MQIGTTRQQTPILCVYSRNVCRLVYYVIPLLALASCSTAIVLRLRADSRALARLSSHTIRGGGGGGGGSVSISAFVCVSIAQALVVCILPSFYSQSDQVMIDTRTHSKSLMAISWRLELSGTGSEASHLTSERVALQDVFSKRAFKIVVKRA